MGIREKIVGKLGMFGYILFYIVAFAIYFMPVYLLPVRPFIRTIIVFVLLIVPALGDIASPFLWIYGLFKVIKGKQDAFAIAYYIVFAIFVIYFVINLISIIRGVKKKNA